MSIPGLKADPGQSASTIPDATFEYLNRDAAKAQEGLAHNNSGPGRSSNV